jgi:hypothetical protein
LFVFPDTLAFTCKAGIKDFPLHLSMVNAGSGSLSWAVTEKPGWLQYDTPSSGIGLNHWQGALVQLSLGDTALTFEPGVYWGNIIVTAPTAYVYPDTVKAKLTVTEYPDSVSAFLDHYPMPHTGPYLIPPTGGSIWYNVGVKNNRTTAQSCTAWVKVRQPNGTWWPSPILGPMAITIPPSVMISRPRGPVSFPSLLSNGVYMLEVGVGSASLIPTDAHQLWALKLSPPLPGEDAGGNGGWDMVEFPQSTGEPFPGEEMAITSTIPQAFALLGAYPNPFNPATTIKFQMPQAGLVNLKVYDTAGRLVTTLVNGLRDAGAHDVTFDGSNLSSGVYLYSLTAGTYSATGKMVLVK